MTTATKRERGRPAYEPTATERDEVELAAACGLAHEDIATSLGISRNTLEKYYDQELSTGAYNRRLKWYRALEKAALKGNVAGQKALLALRPHWALPPLPKPVPQEPEKTGKVVKLGVKQQRQQDARDAATGTGWAELLPNSRLQ